MVEGGFGGGGGTGAKLETNMFSSNWEGKSKRPARTN